MCKPKVERGLGFEKVSPGNLGPLGKRLWRFPKGDSAL